MEGCTHLATEQFDWAADALVGTGEEDGEDSFRGGMERVAKNVGRDGIMWDGGAFEARWVGTME